MAGFKWQDCLPDNDETVEVALAKYKHLQLVYEVSDQTVFSTL